MNKGDLINKIAEDASLTKVQATEALNATLDAITDALKDGKRVTLVGFGTFNVSYRKARTGRNPATKKPIEIPEKVVAKFTPGKELAEVVDIERLIEKLRK